MPLPSSRPVELVRHPGSAVQTQKVLSQMGRCGFHPGNFIQLNILHLTESFSSLNYVAFTFRYFFPNFPPFFFWPFFVFSDHCPSAVPTTAASLQLLLPFLWLLHYNCLKCCFFPRHLPAH